MDDLELIKAVGKMWQEYMDSTSDDDFEVNPPQMEKFKRVYAFFEKMAARYDHAEVKPVKLIPREMVGSIIAEFAVFDVWGESLDEFREIVQYVSVFYTDVHLRGNKVHIEVNVPDVFVPKEQYRDNFWID